MSAMSLLKFVPSAQKYMSMESVFQSSRIYKNPTTGETIVPFKECMTLDGKMAKKSIKERSNGWHSYEYQFEGIKCPAPDFHISLFYDYIYMSGLLEAANVIVRDELLHSTYTAFTDMATASLNSQARSCAIFVSLFKLGLLDRIKDFENYCQLFRVNLNNVLKFNAAGAYNDVQLLGKKNRYTLLRPAVQETFSKDDVMTYYQKNYASNNS